MKDEEEFISQMDKLRKLNELLFTAIATFRNKVTSEYGMNVYTGNNCLKLKIFKEGYPVDAIFKVEYNANVILTFEGGVKDLSINDTTYFRKTIALDKKSLKEDSDYLARRINNLGFTSLIDHYEKIVKIFHKNNRDYDLKNMTALVLKNKLEKQINKTIKYAAGTLYLHSDVSRDKNKPSKLTAQYKDIPNSRETYFDVLLNFEDRIGTFKLFKPDLVDKDGFIPVSCKEASDERYLMMRELQELTMIEKEFNEYFKEISSTSNLTVGNNKG